MYQVKSYTYAISYKVNCEVSTYMYTHCNIPNKRTPHSLKECDVVGSYINDHIFPLDPLITGKFGMSAAEPAIILQYQ